MTRLKPTERSRWSQQNNTTLAVASLQSIRMPPGSPQICTQCNATIVISFPSDDSPPSSMPRTTRTPPPEIQDEIASHGLSWTYDVKIDLSQVLDALKPFAIPLSLLAILPWPLGKRLILPWVLHTFVQRRLDSPDLEFLLSSCMARALFHPLSLWICVVKVARDMWIVSGVILTVLGEAMVAFGPGKMMALAVLGILCAFLAISEKCRMRWEFGFATSVGWEYPLL